MVQTGKHILQGLSSLENTTSTHGLALRNKLIFPRICFNSKKLEQMTYLLFHQGTAFRTHFSFTIASTKINAYWTVGGVDVRRRLLLLRVVTSWYCRASKYTRHGVNYNPNGLLNSYRFTVSCVGTMFINFDVQ